MSVARGRKRDSGVSQNSRHNAESVVDRLFQSKRFEADLYGFHLFRKTGPVAGAFMSESELRDALRVTAIENIERGPSAAVFEATSVRPGVVPSAEHMRTAWRCYVVYAMTASSRQGWRPCCSDYPMIWPFCDPKC